MLWAERALKSADVLVWLQKAIGQHGAPEFLRSDNGSESIAKIVQRWLKENGVKTIWAARGRMDLWRAFTGGSGTNV